MFRVRVVPLVGALDRFPCERGESGQGGAGEVCEGTVRKGRLLEEEVREEGEVERGSEVFDRARGDAEGGESCGDPVTSARAQDTVRRSLKLAADPKASSSNSSIFLIHSSRRFTHECSRSSRRNLNAELRFRWFSTLIAMTFAASCPPGLSDLSSRRKADRD